MASFKDYINEHYEVFNSSVQLDTLDEKLYYDYKIRNGKKTKKWHTTRKNYRVQINKKTGQPKEVYITPSERLKRKIGQQKAAIKRRSKQHNITAKRLKSFHVRHNFGAKYNTANNKVNSKKKGNVDPYLEDNGIYPNMLETMDPRLLCESPWVEVLPDLIWDFYSELSPANWLMQLVSLCVNKEMVSLNLTPKSNNREYENIIHVSEKDLNTIFKNLLKDKTFIRVAKYAYHNDLDQDDIEIFDTTMEKYAPELLAEIK